MVHWCLHLRRKKVRERPGKSSVVVAVVVAVVAPLRQLRSTIVAVDWTVVDVAFAVAVVTVVVVAVVVDRFVAAAFVGKQLAWRWHRLAPSSADWWMDS